VGPTAPPMIIKKNRKQKDKDKDGGNNKTLCPSTSFIRPPKFHKSTSAHQGPASHTRPEARDRGLRRFLVRREGGDPSTFASTQGGEGLRIQRKLSWIKRLHGFRRGRLWMMFRGLLELTLGLPLRVSFHAHSSSLCQWHGLQMRIKGSYKFYMVTTNVSCVKWPYRVLLVWVIIWSYMLP
jgi:hypothetical protein